MKQKAIYTEKQPDVLYRKLSGTRADVFVNKFIKEQTQKGAEDAPEQIVYVYWTNIFSVDPSEISENDVKVKLDFYIDYEPEKEKTIKEKVVLLEQANEELATTVDSILTEVIPSIMGV